MYTVHVCQRTVVSEWCARGLFRLRGSCLCGAQCTCVSVVSVWFSGVCLGEEGPVYVVPSVPVSQ